MPLFKSVKKISLLQKDTMKKLFLSLGVLGLGALFGLLFQAKVQVIQASVSGYSASEFSQYCENHSSTCKKENFNNTKVGSVSCPSNSQQIDKVYVHAGDGNTVYELPDSGFIAVSGNNNNTVQVTANPHPHDLSWIGVKCVPGSSPSATPTPTPSPTRTPTTTPTPTHPPRPTHTPTPTEGLQCKHENAECHVNSSDHPCCEGLTCVPFNPNSENGKCEKPSVSPTSTPTPHSYG